MWRHRRRDPLRIISLAGSLIAAAWTVGFAVVALHPERYLERAATPDRARWSWIMSGLCAVYVFILFSWRRPAQGEHSPLRPPTRLAVLLLALCIMLVSSRFMLAQGAIRPLVIASISILLGLAIIAFGAGRQRPRT